MNAMSQPLPPNQLSKRNTRTLLLVLAVAVGMLGLAFASVPLYRLFCQITGFGGTPMRAEAADTTAATPAALARGFKLTFNTDLNTGLPWQFVPEQRHITVKAGETALVYFKATNSSDHDVTGVALYNVLPERIAPYFIKTQCFCFDEQTIKAGQTVEFPVMFQIDPALADDKALDDVSEVTLSYTFYPSRSQQLEQAKKAYYDSTDGK